MTIDKNRWWDAMKDIKDFIGIVLGMPKDESGGKKEGK